MTCVPWQSRRTIRAFTLAEMLVVVAVVGILVLFAFAGVQSAIRTARSAACQHNLGSIGLGMQSYTTDHGGYFPPHWGTSGSQTISWYGFIAPYILAGPFDPNSPIAACFSCPDSSNAKLKSQTYISTGANNQGQTYGYNYYKITQNYAFQGVVRMQSVKRLSKLVLAGDIPQVGSTQVGQSLPSSMSVYLLYPGTAILSGRHPNSSCNLVFADGHVENVNVQAFTDPTKAYDVENWDPTK